MKISYMDRIDQAFRELERDHGYWFLTGETCPCCPQGFFEAKYKQPVSDDSLAVYYSDQANFDEDGNLNGVIYIYWQGDADIIKQYLSRNKLNVSGGKDKEEVIEVDLDEWDSYTRLPGYWEPKENPEDDWRDDDESDWEDDDDDY